MKSTRKKLFVLLVNKDRPHHNKAMDTNPLSPSYAIGQENCYLHS